jgi:UDP-N-acetylglucosamine--N-acetylmuramyl-(pentapeptide) pyrophosphoryl-undecaprenol N-acetylglucosamine transferase
MKQAQRMPVVIFFAHNGKGVGHITRLLAIAREFRRMILDRGLVVSMFFITSSEGDGRLHEAGFPVFKIPSLQAVSPEVREAIDYPAIAATCMYQLLQTMKPDLLVIDGAPTIALRAVDEVPERDFRNLGCPVAYVNHLVREESFSLYTSSFFKLDRVIIPEFDNHEPKLAAVLPPGSAFVGPIVDIPDEYAGSRSEARRRLGLKQDLYTIYVSTGGGGHRDAQRQIETICSVTCSMPNTQTLIGAGPLYRGKTVQHANVHWRVDNSGHDLILASDVAVSAAGVNSFNELMYFGLPTVFVPLATGADDQFDRARRAERVGAGTLVPLEEVGGSLLPILESWRNEPARMLVSERARNLVSSNGATKAASSLIEMLERKIAPDLVT